MKIENTVIVGSGPAGYTAALYTARADLEPLVIEGFAWGGLLQQTTDVENYPGFPEAIMGPELMPRFRDQAERFGARLVTDQATRIDFAREPGGLHRVFVGDVEHRTRSVILAMGADPRKLGVPGEQELAGRGVSYCATCDAAFFRGKTVIVVGGGDSAMEEAIFLSKFAGSVKIVHRREEFRASAIMLDRARELDHVELVTPYVVERLEGDGTLERVVLRHAPTGDEEGVAAHGLFVAIGHQPNSELVRDALELDDGGYVVTEPGSTRTSVTGVFAAGDLVDHVYRQAVTAAGSGCQAALDAEWYLRDNPHDVEPHWLKPDEIEREAEQAASST